MHGLHYVEVFALPRLIHMESMWNPWNPSAIPSGIHGMNVGWDHSQFIVPWTSWIPYGMIMEWSWNGQFHMDSTAFHMEFRHIHHGIHGQVHMDSMETMDKSIWIPWKPLEYIQAVLETIE